MKRIQNTITEILKGKNTSFISSVTKVDGVPVRFEVTPLEFRNGNCILATGKTSRSKAQYFKINPIACFYACDLNSLRIVKMDGTVTIQASALEKQAESENHSLENADKQYIFTMKFLCTGGHIYCDNHKEFFSIEGSADGQDEKPNGQDEKLDDRNEKPDGRNEKPKMDISA